MLDRRQSPREKVSHAGTADIGEPGTTTTCVVRNISAQGAKVEFSKAPKFRGRRMLLTIARKGRSFVARTVWWRDNFVGVAFRAEAPSEYPQSDLEERVRKSEQKKRELQRRIKELIGER
jgi:PilZ domain-containing protein